MRPLIGRSWVVSGLSLVLLLLVQACGSVSTSGKGPDEASPAIVHPDEPGTIPPATGEPLGGLGQPVQTIPGKVTVTPSASSYEQGEIVLALIASGLDQTIYADDSKSDCSIAFLQRLEGTTWVDVGGCTQRRPPATVAIGPSRGRMASFHPESVNFAPSDGESGLGPGKYRVRFAYRLDEEAIGDDPLEAFSKVFTIT